MAEPSNPDPEAPRAGSDDLLRRAWSEMGGTPARSGRSSDDLIRRARWWLEETKPPEEADLAGDEIVVSAATREAMEQEGRFDDLSRVFEAPRSAPPSRRRLEPVPAPAPAPDERPRRVAWLVAVVLLGLALVAPLTGLLVDEGSDVTVPTRPVVATTSAVPWEATDRSTGSLTSPWTDACSGTDITGDLTADITYREAGPDAEVAATITGDLRGADGAGYTLLIEGTGSGEAGQASFTFPAARMLLVRDDGTEFVEDATITVGVADRQPDDWSFSIDPFTCRP